MRPQCWKAVSVIYYAKVHVVHVAKIHASIKIPSVDFETRVFKTRFGNGNAKRETQNAKRRNARFEATKP